MVYILPAFFKVAVWRAFFCIAIRRIGNFPLYRICTCLLKNTFKAAGLFFFTIPLVFPLGNRVVKICDEHYVFNPKMINICCFTPLPGCKFQLKIPFFSVLIIIIGTDSKFLTDNSTIFAVIIRRQQSGSYDLYNHRSGDCTMSFLNVQAGISFGNCKNR